MGRSYLVFGLMLIGCGDGVIKLGLGEETDARFTSDVYTWDCSAGDQNWMGAFSFDVSLVYTPDNLASRALPAPNACVSGLSMFALDTLEGGTDIPEADEPEWTTGDTSGKLRRQLPGLYYDDVFKNVFSCDPVDSIISSGVKLVDSGTLSGVSTPEAGEVVQVSTDLEAAGGVPFGETFNLSWDASGWDESFIQIRRARSEMLVETLTCNTTGRSEFAIDSGVWGELDETVNANRNYLYVGFRNTDNVMSEAGQRVDIETRALHVVGLTNL